MFQPKNLLLREQAGVYVLYDDNFRLVDVGQAGALGAARPFIKSGDILNHIEAILISAAEPPHNRQGGRFGEAVEQSLQY